MAILSAEWVNGDHVTVGTSATCEEQGHSDYDETGHTSLQCASHSINTSCDRSELNNKLINYIR